MSPLYCVMGLVRTLYGSGHCTAHSYLLYKYCIRLVGYLSADNQLADEEKADTCSRMMMADSSPAHSPRSDKINKYQLQVSKVPTVASSLASSTWSEIERKEEKEK